jgi:hypothetical protein
MAIITHLYDVDQQIWFINSLNQIFAGKIKQFKGKIFSDINQNIIEEKTYVVEYKDYNQKLHSIFVLEEDIFASLEDAVYFLQSRLITGTPLPSITATPVLTVTPTMSITPSTTITPTVTPSVTPTITPTVSETSGVTPTPSVTPTITPTVSITPSPTPTVTPSATLNGLSIFGDDSAGTSSNPGGSDKGIVSQFIMPVNGNIQSYYAHFAASSLSGASAKIIIYSSVANMPDTLVLVSDANTIPDGGGWVQFSGNGSLPAGTYFMGVVYNSFEANISCDNDGGTYITKMTNGNLSYTSPPTTFPTDSIVDYTDIQVNVYAEYLPS